MQNYTEAQTIEHKAEWGNGIWQTEPDVASWNDDASGYPVEVARNPETGSLGFRVGVPPDHPAFKLDGDHVPFDAVGLGISTQEQDGVWWFQFKHDQGHHGKPGTNENIDRYRGLLDVQEMATTVAHRLWAYAGQNPREEPKAVGGPAEGGATWERRRPAELPEVPAEPREPLPEPPNLEAAATESPEAPAEAEDLEGPDDVEEGEEEGSGVSRPSKRRKKH